MKAKQTLTIKDGETAWVVIQNKGLAPAWFRPPIALKCHDCGQPADYCTVLKDDKGSVPVCSGCICQTWLNEFATELDITWEDKW